LLLASCQTVDYRSLCRVKMTQPNFKQVVDNLTSIQCQHVIPEIVARGLRTWPAVIDYMCAGNSIGDAETFRRICTHFEIAAIHQTLPSKLVGKPAFPRQPAEFANSHNSSVCSDNFAAASASSAMPTANSSPCCSSLSTVPDCLLTRVDVPVKRARLYEKGSLAAALSAAAATNRQSALNCLERDKFAASSHKPIQSRWKTWCSLADAWNIPPLPLTTNTINCIAASLKAGEYVSCKNYFETAVQQHVKTTGCMPPPAVSTAIREATRSILRGLLTKQLKHAFLVEQLATVPPDPHYTNWSSTTPGRCIAPRALCILGAWFLLRGIEAAGCMRRHIQLDHDQRVVSLELPVSKTDTGGRGTTRKHGCCCIPANGASPTGHSSERHPLCPYHTAAALQAQLQARFGETNHFLFCDKDGRQLTQEAVVQAIRGCLASCEVADVNMFAEHALRVSGAQFLARNGIDTHLIALLGRWGSTAIFRYIQEAPLATSADIARRATTGSCSRPQECALEDIPNTTAAVQNNIQQAIVLVDPDCEPCNGQDEGFSGKMILNVKTNCTHIINKSTTMHVSSSWRANCGWFFATCPYKHVDTPVGHFCPRCFRHNKISQQSSSSDGSGTEAAGDNH